MQDLVPFAPITSKDETYGTPALQVEERGVFSGHARDPSMINKAITKTRFS
jgi:hypothetical protein